MTVVIRHNTRGSGDWCTVLVDGAEAYAGHGDFSPHQVAALLVKAGVADVQFIETDDEDNE